MKFIKLFAIACTSLLLTACSSTSSNSSSTPSSPLPSSTIDLSDRITSRKSSYQEIVQKGNGQPLLPSLGEPNILVIPVVFKGLDFVSLDPTLNSNDEAKEIIEDSFFGDREDGEMESLKTYYSKSSYGKLNIKGTVSDVVTAPQTYNYYSTLSQSGWAGGVSGIIQTALNSLNSEYDFTYFDSDGDKYFDAIWLVYSAHISQSNMFWAFVDWASSRTSYDGIRPGAFAWASYEFFNNRDYGEHKDTHTLIHETGHLLGLSDYYNAEGTYPAGGLDMMDFSVGDHMAFNKYNFGWIYPRVIRSDGNYTLKPIHSDGEALIIGAPNYNNSPFWEYYIIEYYKPEGLNKLDSESEYTTGVRMFTESGVRIYHVNQKLEYADQIYSWDDEYINDINSIEDKPYIIVNSNASNLSSNPHDVSIKLVSLLSADKNHTITSLASNDDLFQIGDYYTDRGEKWEDGTDVNFSILISGTSEEQMTVSIVFE